jgi:hypothetical protein
LERFDDINNNNTYALCVCGDIIRKEYMNGHKNSDRLLKRMDGMSKKIDSKALAYNHKQDIIKLL